MNKPLFLSPDPGEQASRDSEIMSFFKPERVLPVPVVSLRQATRILGIRSAGILKVVGDIAQATPVLVMKV